MSALRISVPGRETVLIPEKPDPWDILTPSQRRILQAVYSTNGNRSRAARYLGCHVTNVQIAVRRIKRVGVHVPAAPNCGAGRGPDLQPRRNRTSARDEAAA